jgi:hypothetical protein
MGVLSIILPRRVALLPLIIACSYMTVGQRILIFDKDINIFRILFLFGWVRLLLRGEIQKSFRFNVIDKTLIYWAIASIILGAFVDATVLVQRLGSSFNAIGIYFLCRFLIRDLEDIEMLFRYVAILIVPLTIAMIIEKSTGRNLFAVFGGVPETTMIRSSHEGATFFTRIRCQGPFRHPILAGTFGTVLIPLFVGLWFKEKIRKSIAIIGIASASIIIFCAASSGPVLTLMCVLFGFLIWPLRQNMRKIRWGIVCAVLGLHLIMKEPVWYIFSRMSGIMGGTGWHRSELINQAITRFGEWWLFGTTYTAHWMPYTLRLDPNMTDITNQYIWEGVSGGVVKLILFISLIAFSFRKVGLSIKAVKNEPFTIKFMIWSTGVSLVAHTVSFLSVAYFDQMIVFWYLLLAMIAALPRQTGDSSVSAKFTAEPIHTPTHL